MFEFLIKYINMKRTLLSTVLVLSLISVSSCSKDNPTPTSHTCPDHYSGSNCDVQEEPASMTITRIDVTKYPATNAGSSWDLDGSGPDLFPKVVQNGTTIYNSPTYSPDATDPNATYTFTPAQPVSIVPATQCTIQLYDYDNGASSDNMGGLIITPYSSTGGYPASVSYTGANNIAYNVYFSYTF